MIPMSCGVSDRQCHGDGLPERVALSEKDGKCFFLSSFPGYQKLFQVGSWVIWNCHHPDDGRFKVGIIIIYILWLFSLKRNANSPVLWVLVTAENYFGHAESQHYGSELCMEHLWGWKTTIPQRTTGSSWLCEILCPRHGAQESKHGMHVVVWKVPCCLLLSPFSLQSKGGNEISQPNGASFTVTIH